MNVQPTRRRDEMLRDGDSTCTDSLIYITDRPPAIMVRGEGMWKEKANGSGMGQ